MPDGAQVNGVVLAELLDGRVRQRFAGAQIAVSAEIVFGVIQFEAELGGSGIDDLDGFAGDLGAGPVAG